VAPAQEGGQAGWRDAAGRGAAPDPDSRQAGPLCRRGGQAGRRQPARAFAKAASNLQDELGEQHDAVVAEAWLREKAGSSRGTTILAAGQLIAAERTAAQAARERWRPAWKTVAGKKRTGWL
jgi:hypothetical protein